MRTHNKRPMPELGSTLRIDPRASR
ncbi:unnamed protein product, partial [Rotaria sp. Silwood2]